MRGLRWRCAVLAALMVMAAVQPALAISAPGGMLDKLLEAGQPREEAFFPEETVFIAPGAYINSSTLITQEGNLIFSGSCAFTPEDPTDLTAEGHERTFREGFVLMASPQGEILWRVDAGDRTDDSSYGVIGQLPDGHVLVRYQGPGYSMESPAYFTIDQEGNVAPYEMSPKLEEMFTGYDWYDGNPRGIIRWKDARLGEEDQQAGQYVMYDWNGEEIFNVAGPENVSGGRSALLWLEDGIAFAGVRRDGEGSIVARVVYKLGYDGKLLWIFDDDDSPYINGFGFLAPAEEGGLVLTSSYVDDLTGAVGALTCLNADGTLRWEKSLEEAEIGYLGGLAPVAGGFACSGEDGDTFNHTLLIHVDGEGNLLSKDRISAPPEAFVYVNLAWDEAGGAYAYGTYNPDSEDMLQSRIFYVPL